jgi:uncharacterized protein YaaW (UPF0174 family)
MELELKISGLLKKPLNKIDESQQKRFIQQLQRTNVSREYKFGIEIALLILGYEIKND